MEGRDGGTEREGTRAAIPTGGSDPSPPLALPRPLVPIKGRGRGVCFMVVSGPPSPFKVHRGAHRGEQRCPAPASHRGARGRGGRRGAAAGGDFEPRRDAPRLLRLQVHKPAWSRPPPPPVIGASKRASEQGPGTNPRSHSLSPSLSLPLSLPPPLPLPLPLPLSLSPSLSFSPSLPIPLPPHPHPSPPPLPRPSPPPSLPAPALR